MRIGIVVDGESEFGALPQIQRALEEATGNTILKPVLVEVAATASIETIAFVMAAELRNLEKRGLDLAILPA